MEYRLVAQEYGKDDSFGGTYRILKQHDEMLRFERQIRDAFSFQWMPGPGVYRPVWYFLRLDASQGLLAVFSDKGGDPRPHVLGRIVALCNKHEHIPLLLAVQNSAVNSFSCDDSGILTIDCVPGQGEFEWSTRILQAGDRGSYVGLGESPEPGQRKSAPKPTPLPTPTPSLRATPPSRTNAPCSSWVLRILLVLCLSSIIIAIFFYNRSQQCSSELEDAQAEIASLKNTLSEESDQVKKISDLSEAEKRKYEERCKNLEKERKNLQDALDIASKRLSGIVTNAEEARNGSLPKGEKSNNDTLSEKVEGELQDIIEHIKPFVPGDWNDR
ncbi:MAG: hypothetical protein ACI4OX_08740 [Akkermansia sp.]